MKYVMLEMQYAGCARRVPIVFPNFLVHAGHVRLAAAEALYEISAGKASNFSGEAGLGEPRRRKC